MKTEPDFELLPERKSPVMRWVLIVSVASALVSCLWAAHQWRALRQAEHELQQVLARQAQTRSTAASAPPSIDPEIQRALDLIRTPIGAWLRELENCQPENARTKQLRVDAVTRKVTTTVEVQGPPDLEPWMDCLNAGLVGKPWRAARMSNSASSAAKQEAPTWNWTVELERAERGGLR